MPMQVFVNIRLAQKKCIIANDVRLTDWFWRDFAAHHTLLTNRNEWMNDDEPIDATKQKYSNFDFIGD